MLTPAAEAHDPAAGAGPAGAEGAESEFKEGAHIVVAAGGDRLAFRAGAWEAVAAH